LLRQGAAGDQHALRELWDRYRVRLKRMVRLRLDRRLQGRLDPSDVLQEAFLDFARRAGEFAENPEVSFFLWLRTLTGQRLQMLHRQHLGAKMRDAAREATAREIQTLVGHTDWVTGVSFNPDCSRLASSSRVDGTIMIWDVTRLSGLR
jgi:DNA-directed RNA polymerase specialized sigma24 family protein